MSGSEDLVVLEERVGYAIIKLNRAAKRNALNRAMRIELLAVLERIRNRFHVCIVTGAETSFCSGVDLKEYERDVKERRPPDPKTDWANVILTIRDHPTIFIAAVNGFALGGGLTLINACELAVAAKGAQIGMPEIGFATYPTLAGPATQLSVSRKVAAWMVLTAERIDGETAERWNIVNACVPSDRLLGVAEELAAKLAKFDATALAESKKALDVIPLTIGDWRQAFEYAEGVNARIERSSKAPAEGLSKFTGGERNATQGSQKQ